MKKIQLIIIIIMFFAHTSFAEEGRNLTNRDREIVSDSYDTEAQNKLAKEIANNVEKDASIAKRGYLITEKDTLGALVLGLSKKKRSFWTPVKLIISDDIKGTFGNKIEDMSEEIINRISGIPLDGIVSDYNLILPGFFVWIDKGTVIMSNDHPTDIKIFVLGEEKEEEKKKKTTELGNYFLLQM